ncbi:MAG: 7-carboxy-7-deazaguanine synthase QueE [Bdellovibrionales bacterium]
MQLSFTNDYIFETIQGEGIFTGIPSVFIRLSGCNLRCEWRNHDGSTSLCDTPYSSHNPEKLIKSLEQVHADVSSFATKHFVVTGGEPFLQKNVTDLIDLLVSLGKFVTVETNGSLYLESKAQFISLSPKLSTSCVNTSANYQSHQAKRINIEALKSFVSSHDFQLKFVVNQALEFDEVEEIVKSLSDTVDEGLLRSRVLMMPQAVTAEQLKENSPVLIEECIRRGYRFCDRLHVRLWGDKRGV